MAESLLSSGHGASDGVPGIDQLLGKKGVVIDAVLRREKKEGEQPLFTMYPRKIPINDSGLDLDRYMRAFGKSLSDKIKINGFGEVLKRSKAISAVLFSDDDGYCVSISIGLTNKTAALLQFDREDPFYTEYLQKKKIVFVRHSFGNFSFFRNRFSSEDLRFIQACIFFPGLMDRKPAYIFLGFPGIDTFELREIFDRLEVFPA
ncbi:MAG: hypothetical protein EHM28_14075 [Spirochaetaceae bacterium]|nr:MAG: hypothetical protein EHM28_14075 [Spirochaetaceae bacterium]